MADILIRGFRKPKSCDECFNESDCIWFDCSRCYRFCRISELPEHGDLIDRVAFREEMDNHYPFGRGTQRRHGEADAAKSTIINMLANAPVIVPSNKEESE